MATLSLFGLVPAKQIYGNSKKRQSCTLNSRCATKRQLIIPSLTHHVD